MLNLSLTTKRSSKLPAVLVGMLMFVASGTAYTLTNDPQFRQQTSSEVPIHGIRHAQNDRQNSERRYQNDSQQSRSVRSRNEVMREVKQRHRGAEVLKISLNRNRTMYSVRVLMPSGKVRSLKVSASR